MARAVALNLLKAAALVALLAAAFGGLGWLIGGGRRRSCSCSARCSPRPASTATGTARCSGCSARVRSRLRRIRSCAPGRTRSRRSSAFAPPQLYLIDDGFPRLFAVGRGPTSSTLAVSTGALKSLRREELEACDRARARPRPTPRRARADLRRPLRYDARRDEPDRRLVLARASLRVRADRRRVRARAALPEARAPGGRARRAARPAPRTISPTRSCASTARPSSSSSQRLPRPSRSTRSTRSSTRASRGCSRRTRRSTHRVRRLRELGAGSNGRVPARHSRSSPGSSENITESRIRPSGWRRCARSTPSRWKPTFSATRCDATLSGSVTRSTRWSSSSSSA